jgi:predicted nucleic acid-binding protein
MKVILDTNVVLDALLSREPFARSAARIMAAAETRQLQAVLCATTVTTIHYLTTKWVGKARASRAIASLTDIFQLAQVDHDVVAGALRSRIDDFEDAVLHEAGRLAGADILVTRDAAGFRKASLVVLTPEELLARLKSDDLGLPDR